MGKFFDAQSLFINQTETDFHISAYFIFPDMRFSSSEEMIGVVSNPAAIIHAAAAAKVI